jgi:hypothetical protein
VIDPFGAVTPLRTGLDGPSSAAVVMDSGLGALRRPGMTERR